MRQFARPRSVVGDRLRWSEQCMATHPTESPPQSPSAHARRAGVRRALVGDHDLRVFCQKLHRQRQLSGKVMVY